MEELIAKIPKPKVGNVKLLRVDKITVPHPYCITPKHLTGESMYLTNEVIRDAEKKHGAVCDICRCLVKQGKQKSILNFDEHQEGLTLFIEVAKGDLNKVKGLKEYLLEIKPILQELKIDGVAFKQV